jgi:hypothetical protein
MERNAGRFRHAAVRDVGPRQTNVRIRVVCAVRGDPLCGCWYPQDAPHDPRAYGRSVNNAHYTRVTT